MLCRCNASAAKNFQGSASGAILILWRIGIIMQKKAKKRNQRFYEMCIRDRVYDGQIFFYQPPLGSGKPFYAFHSRHLAVAFSQMRMICSQR